MGVTNQVLEFNRSTLHHFQERLAELKPTSKRQWGKMDAARMIRHLRFTLQMSLGQEKVVNRSLPVLREVIFLFSFRIFTRWPKGVLKAPAYLTPPTDGDMETERQLLLEKMEQFADALERRPQERYLNPILGRLPLLKWSRVHALHCDHHLRQFGV